MTNHTQTDTQGGQTPSFEIFIPGKAVSQPRPRVFRLPNGQTRAVSLPKNHPASTWKQRILVALNTYMGPIIEGPLEMEVIFVFDRPKRLQRKKDPEGAILHDKKPDLDNLLKIIKDTFNGIVWKDDSQVCRISLTKIYTRKTDGRIGAWVTVRNASPVENSIQELISR